MTKQSLFLYLSKDQFINFLLVHHPNLPPNMSDDENSFNLLNNSAPAFWVLMVCYLLVPKLRPARYVVRGYILAVCAMYLVKLIPILQAGEINGFAFQATVQALGKPNIVVICWAHFIAFDLHAAYTVVETVHSNGWSLIWRALLIPILVVICLYGPVGFLAAHTYLGVAGYFIDKSARLEDESRKELIDNGATAPAVAVEERQKQ
eukprot:TRINITY_DN697_c0_g1_i2.p1 TRINITY_DN697_c0_g1~~TRINITY_DN697_c0_g1_i2.p1  ORF type:complete len:206 (+),score=44.64 TRINITY_DN697_c0_g1_i2:586-1203(+)